MVKKDDKNSKNRVRQQMILDADVNYYQIYAILNTVFWYFYIEIEPNQLNIENRTLLSVVIYIGFISILIN